jgi:hypothetical protein
MRHGIDQERILGHRDTEQPSNRQTEVRPNQRFSNLRTAGQTRE